MVGDCLGVVRACHRGMGAHLRKAKFGGLLRQAWQVPHGRDAMSQMEKVKAHQDIEQLQVGTLEHLRASGNDEAGKAANRARGLHPAASPQAWAMCDLDFADALVVCKLAARALARWPTSLPRVEVCERHRAEQRAAAERRKLRRAMERRAVHRRQAENLQSH